LVYVTENSEETEMTKGAKDSEKVMPAIKDKVSYARKEMKSSMRWERGATQVSDLLSKVAC
jgi:hypothetical protein